MALYRSCPAVQVVRLMTGEHMNQVLMRMHNTCIPNLGLNDLSFGLNASGSKLDSNGGLRFEAKLVSGESR
jgi:hypothetical protein